MPTRYNLCKTGSGRYQQLNSEQESAIVRSLSIYGFGDCIRFSKKTGHNSSFGSYWGLENLGCFKELNGYQRLMNMSRSEVKRLAARIYELLFISQKRRKRYYETEPQIDETNPKYQQIHKELRTLQKTQKRLIDSNILVFPRISIEELACSDSW